MNRRGFTLVELLATILIIGLVLGLTAYGIISSVGSAKGQSITLSLSGVKEAARTYSGEFTDDSWKNINDYDDLYFCVTVEELINKGLLDKNAKKIESGGKLVNYVVVVKNKSTRVIGKEQLLTDEEQEQEDKAYGICTGTIKNEVIERGTKIDKSTSYTDTIDIDFTDPKFETNITDRYCEYGISSSNLDKKVSAGDGVCTLDGLSQETSYYTRVCATSERKSVSCSDTISVSTKKIVSPGIEVGTDSSVKITYNNTNIKGDGYYYFKSTMDATSDKKVSTCSLNTKNEFICNNDSLNNVLKNTWYRTTNKEVVLTYKDSGNVTVTAETRDKSNNSKQSNKDFSLYKIIFDKGTADTIGGQSNNIEKLCIANKGKSCSISSPSIERSNYNIVGWNTNSSATTSSWNVNVTKNISSNATYYPITKQSTYTITYDNNGGSGCTSKSVKYNETLGELCTPERAGYTFIGWFNADYKDKPLNYYADTYSDLKDAFGYDANSLYNHYSTYGRNEGRRLAQYISSDTYNNSKDITIYAGWKINRINVYYHVNGGTLQSNNSSFSTSGGNVTLNGSTLIESYDYGSMLSSTGLYNYNNPGYINIVKTGYKALSGKEWNTKADGTGTSFNQDTVYDANDLCDASKKDCDVTLYVNWIKEDSINDYRCAASGSDYYYITTCDTNSCNYTIKNGSNTSGTVIRNNLRHCNKITFYANGGSFSNGTTSFFFMATPGVRYSFNSSYYIEGIGMPTVSKSGCSLSGWYYYPESKVIYSWFDVNSDEYNVELKANWYCPSSGGGDSSGNLGNGCPSSTPNRLTKGATVYCCSLGVTDPGNPGTGKSCIAIYEGNAGTVPACGYCTSSAQCRSSNSCGASCISNQCRVYLTKPNGSCLGIYDSCN